MEGGGFRVKGFVIRDEGAGGRIEVAFHDLGMRDYGGI